MSDKTEDITEAELDEIPDGLLEIGVADWTEEEFDEFVEYWEQSLEDEDVVVGRTTETESTRWKYTNDVALAMVMATYLGVWGYLHLAGHEVPLYADYISGVVILLAAFWAFGPKTVESLLEVFKKKP